VKTKFILLCLHVIFILLAIVALDFLAFHLKLVREETYIIWSLPNVLGVFTVWHWINEYRYYKCQIASRWETAGQEPYADIVDA
jgi:hypothetical protein